MYKREKKCARIRSVGRSRASVGRSVGRERRSVGRSVASVGRSVASVDEDSEVAFSERTAVEGTSCACA